MKLPNSTQPKNVRLGDPDPREIIRLGDTEPRETSVSDASSEANPESIENQAKKSPFPAEEPRRGGALFVVSFWLDRQCLGVERCGSLLEQLGHGRP